MYFRVLSFSLALTVTLLNASFISESQACKRARETEEVDQKSIVPIQKPSITDFLEEHVQEGVCRMAREEFFGTLSSSRSGLNTDTFIRILSFIEPASLINLKLVNSSFYTLTTGYSRPRLGLIGCGDDKLPDYWYPLFAASSAGIRDYESSEHILDQYEPETIPSSLWYVQLKVAKDTPLPFIKYLKGTLIDEIFDYPMDYNYEEWLDTSLPLLAKILPQTNIKKIEMNVENGSGTQLIRIAPGLPGSQVEVLDVLSMDSICEDTLVPWSNDDIVNVFLHIGKSNVQTLVMSGCFFDDGRDGEGFRIILENLKHSKMKKLILDDNDLSNAFKREDAAEFLKFINESKLEELSLKGCRLTDKAVLLLADIIIGKNKSLKSLNLRNNNLKKEVANFLLERFNEAGIKLKAEKFLKRRFDLYPVDYLKSLPNITFQIDNEYDDPHLEAEKVSLKFKQNQLNNETALPFADAIIKNNPALETLVLKGQVSKEVTQTFNKRFTDAGITVVNKLDPE